jgi:hypothetical protein
MIKGSLDKNNKFMDKENANGTNVYGECRLLAKTRV